MMQTIKNFQDLDINVNPGYGMLGSGNYSGFGGSRQFAIAVGIELLKLKIPLIVMAD